jgi:hypothetical protein
MPRAQLLIAFSAALLVLACSALPASAWFSGPGPQGVANSIGVSALTAPGGAQVFCSKMLGAWHIETTGKVANRQKTEQFLTKTGPHLGLTISKWEGCFGPARTPTTIEPCLLQVEQPLKGSTTGTFSIGQTCKIKIPALACELEVPASASNEGLATVTLEKTATGVEVKAAITGVTTVVPAGSVTKCAAIGIVATKGNTFNGTVLASEVELV